MDPFSDLSKDQLLQIISDALHAKTASSPPGSSKHGPPELKSSQNFSGKTTQTTQSDGTPQKETAPLTTAQTPTPKDIPTQQHSPEQLISDNTSFTIPVEEVLEKLNEIQSISSTLGNSEKKLRSWYNNSIRLNLDNFLSTLNKDKNKLNNDFIKSLETITKIFSITSRFSPIETVDESVLTPTIRRLIMDYNSNQFQTLDCYCDEDLSMHTLNNDIEENLIHLIPVLSQQLLTFNKQLKKFYDLYELIDDYTFIDKTFLDSLPTKSDINLFSQINKATDIKLILQTNFNKINPILIDQLDNEIKNLTDFINLKTSELKSLIERVVHLNHELFDPADSEYLTPPSSVHDNDQLLSNIGISSKVFEEYEETLKYLNELKTERETLLNCYLLKVENLWSILRPNSNEIQKFLKLNKNLKLQSLTNFEQLLNELEIEKMANIKNFIMNSREKIEGFWDILMYDEISRKRFADFYISDPSLFNEKLLDSHSEELERLRNESEAIKPMLKLISNLNDLLDEKKNLDEASKNPSRLLKRNSFIILREEEKLRDKLNKQFPIVIGAIKSQIQAYETENGRSFKLNGESYLQKLQEIETEFFHKKRHSRSSIHSPAVSLKRKPTKNTTTSGKSINKSKFKTVSTPSRSIIRKRDPNQMPNPFLSKNPTPVSKMNEHYSNMTPSTINSFPNSSTARSLNLNASTKIQAFDKIKSPNILSLGRRKSKSPAVLSSRSPMSSITNRFNNYNYSKSDNVFNKNISNLIIHKDSIITNKIPTPKTLKTIPVEELSDSILDDSDAENEGENVLIDELQLNKENREFEQFSATINKQAVRTTQNFNLSLDSETF